MKEFSGRRSIRLKGFDYHQPGKYFITISTQNREKFFGEVINGTMVTNDAGRMVEQVWREIPLFYEGVTIDAFQVMPDHFHGVVVLLSQESGYPPVDIQTEDQKEKRLSLPDVVHRFKTMTTKLYCDGVHGQNWIPFEKRLWGWNYYEHIIRCEEEAERICKYIRNNPLYYKRH